MIIIKWKQNVDQKLSCDSTHCTYFTYCTTAIVGTLNLHQEIFFLFYVFNLFFSFFLFKTLNFYCFRHDKCPRFLALWSIAHIVNIIGSLFTPTPSVPSCFTIDGKYSCFSSWYLWRVFNINFIEDLKLARQVW